MPDYVTPSWSYSQGNKSWQGSPLAWSDSDPWTGVQVAVNNFSVGAGSFWALFSSKRLGDVFIIFVWSVDFGNFPVYFLGPSY